MQTEFTPFLSLLGGALIGLSAVLLMLVSGKIAGISGIVGRALPPSVNSSEMVLSIAFIAGLLCALPLYKLLSGGPAQITMVAGTGMLLIAGFVTGFGAIVGNGCTSGHGVCGLSRLSVRSMVATGTFMFTAFIVVYISRHLAGAS